MSIIEVKYVQRFILKILKHCRVLVKFLTVISILPEQKV